MNHMSCKGISGYLIIGFTIIIAVCLSLFANWEMGGESWGYWYFARVFAETGGFIVLDRSPLYILYLNLFTWIPYPASVTTAYLVTTSITVIALVAFFRQYLGIWLALLAACLWIPYLQRVEHPCQELALACSLIAVLLRGDKSDRFRLVASYAFLFSAFCFRPTYMALIVAFLSYDAVRTMRESGIRSWFSRRPKLASDWPLLLVSILFLWFLACQSSSPWNTVWFCPAPWFPGDAKKITGGGALQAFNWLYSILKYGTFECPDWYFTNREAFGGATSYLGMLLANPHLVLEIVIFNLKSLVPTIMTGIWIPKTGIKFVDYFFAFILFVGTIYGALRVASNGSSKILVVGSLAQVGITTVIGMPNWRWMVPMIPVFIMAVSWYGAILTAFLKNQYPSDETRLQKLATAIFAVGILWLLFYSIKDFSTRPLWGTVFLAGTFLIFFCASILFSVARFARARLRTEMSRYALALPTVLLLVMFGLANVSNWVGILHNVHADVGRSRLHILESREASMKAAYPTLADITQRCRGIMSLESGFWGAFLNIPQSRIYSISEIPPFGHLHNSPYKGLSPDRIDCVLVSTALTKTVATVVQSRYQNYIKPYIDQLISSGAVKYEIPFYGHAIVLQ